jgi:ABC-type thiamine transport system ATPase subunit
VVDLMAELVRRHGATLLMVTHSRDAAAAADRVVILSDGRVVGDSLAGDAAVPAPERTVAPAAEPDGVARELPARHGRPARGLA